MREEVLVLVSSLTMTLVTDVSDSLGHSSELPSDARLMVSRSQVVHVYLEIDSY